MVTLQQIEAQLTTAMKAKDSVAVDALRGLKTRITNEQIAKQGQLSPDDLVNVVRSEIKKRKEAAESFTKGNRPEMANKENQEAAIFEKFLPPQASAEEISAAVDEILSSGQFTAKDFGKVMAQLKAKFGSSADGGMLSTVLKEKIK